MNHIPDIFCFTHEHHLSWIHRRALVHSCFSHYLSTMHVKILCILWCQTSERDVCTLLFFQFLKYSLYQAAIIICKITTAAKFPFLYFQSLFFLFSVFCLWQLSWMKRIGEDWGKRRFHHPLGPVPFFPTSIFYSEGLHAGFIMYSIQ